MPFVLISWFLLMSAYVHGQQLTIYRSTKSVETTTQVLEDIIRQEGLIFFETVSHDQIAKTKGLNLPPTRSILFEEPTLITTLLQCQQTTALDLPLEIIVWEEEGDVFIGFMDPRLMTKKYLMNGCEETLDQLSKLMIKVAMNTIRQLQG